MSATERIMSKSEKPSTTDTAKSHSTQSSPTVRSPVNTGMSMPKTTTAVQSPQNLPFDSKFAASIDSMNKVETIPKVAQNTKGNTADTPTKQDKTVIRRGRGRPSNATTDRPGTSKQSPQVSNVV
jgi:hypothetical protein